MSALSFYSNVLACARCMTVTKRCALVCYLKVVHEQLTSMTSTLILDINFGVYPDEPDELVRAGCTTTNTVQTQTTEMPQRPKQGQFLHKLIFC